MMKEITVGELKKMTDKEGLILQGCGGDLKEWEDGVNELLTESGILLEGDTFKNVYVFENEGWTIVNKKDTIFKYIFWERLDSLPIPECCFHFVWCQIA